MSLHNDVANPSEDGGFTKLLAGIIIFNRNKKPASALPPFLSIKLFLPSGAGIINQRSLLWVEPVTPRQVPYWKHHSKSRPQQFHRGYDVRNNPIILASTVKYRC